MAKALLICNGEKPTRWLKKYAKEADFILAADGGADAACAVGVRPNAVIGDLDSVSLRTQKRLKDTAFIHVKRQDNTDLEKALDWLVKQGFESCTIAGAMGGRLDFTLANLLITRPYLKKIKICFQGENWALYPVQKDFSLMVKKGLRLSLIPLTTCRGVSLKGCRYPLDQEDLNGKNVGRTLSNQTQSTQLSLQLQSGLLFLYIEKKRS